MSIPPPAKQKKQTAKQYKTNKTLTYHANVYIVCVLCVYCVCKDTQSKDTNDTKDTN